MNPGAVNLNEYKELLKFETLLTDLSTKFVNLPVDQVHDEIESTLKQICEYLHLDIATFWEWEVGSAEVLLLTHLHRPLGGKPVPARMTATESFPWCWEQVLQKKVVALSNTEDAPAEAAVDLAGWRHYGIKSDLSFPLAAGGGEIQGVLAFSTTQSERIWTDSLVKRLELIAQVFSNAIVRKQTELALRESETRLRLATDRLADKVSCKKQGDFADLKQRYAQLTPREREVMAHVVSGKLNKQIAADLGTVEQTIKAHRSRMMKKMSVRSVADLVRMALRLGIND